VLTQTPELVQSPQLKGFSPPIKHKKELLIFMNNGTLRHSFTAIAVTALLLSSVSFASAAGHHRGIKKANRHAAHTARSNAPDAVNAVSAGWDTSPLPGGSGAFGPSPYAATSSDPNVTVGGLTRGSGVGTTGTAAARAWGGVDWQNTSQANAITGGDFFTFTLTPNVSSLTLTTMDLSYRRSGTGPGVGELQFSTDGTIFTDLAALTYASTSASGATLTGIDISGVGVIGVGTTLTFRIVNWGGTSAAGTWYVYDTGISSAPDLVINDNVVIPEPATSMLIGVGLLVVAQRFIRRKKS
jgi:PEP-CTERM motif